MKTIAHFIEEDIKIHQGYIYNQMVKITEYRSIILGTFDYSYSEYRLDQYYNINQIDDLEQFFREQHIIAIHVHHGKHVNTILPFSITYRIPIVLSIRGRDGSARYSSLTRNQNRYAELVNYGSLYMPVCQFLADEIKILGFPPEKTHVLYGGIELDLFTYSKRSLPSDEEVRILSVGRLVEKKGFDILIKAFQLVHAKFPNTSLHIIGTGPNENQLNELIDILNLNDAVFMRGVMNSKQIFEELQAAHIFCLASQTALDGDVEGIPNVIKEAMASGLPVVSTRHAGIPELIDHNVTGYLVSESNEIELAEGIEFFLQNPQVWDDYTQKARKVIEQNFDFRKQIIEQQRLYALLEKNVISGYS